MTTPRRSLRGIAMAQLGDYARAKELLRRAANAFEPEERLSRARCLAAEAEVALAARELDASARSLTTAIKTLDRLGDTDNALHARLIAARRSLLLGEIDRAERQIDEIEGRAKSPVLESIRLLIRAEIALRRVRTGEAQKALNAALVEAQRARITALSREIERTARALSDPAAELHEGNRSRSITLAEVEALFASNTLVIDACRRVVRTGDRVISLANRPVLFALARALGEAGSEVARDELIRRVFAARVPNESHRARLRVEIGRLRDKLRGLARVEATTLGFELCTTRPIALITPPIEGDDAALVALLEDGEAWSTSALALALGASQRTTQRALARLMLEEKVRSIGRGRAQRWLAPPRVGFATTLLLPGPVAGG